MYDVLNLAKNVVKMCIEWRCPITNLQLNYILYYLQRDYLVLHHRPLYTYDFEAWKCGPVLPKVYSCFLGNGARPIKWFLDIHKIEPLDGDIQFIEIIVKRYCIKSFWDMCQDLCREGGAWDTIRKQRTSPHDIIPVRLIEEEVVDIKEIGIN